jgi:NADH:ubiquinone oxidoreductase subunit 6 (subunit J)
MAQRSGVLREGARRVWSYQRALWWLFIVNLLTATFSAIPVGSHLGKVTDQSLHSQRLANGFDVMAFLELSANPEVSFWSHTTSTIPFMLIYFVFALFVTGGILSAYALDRKLTTGEFFQAAGTYFWRWVRLLIYLLIVMTPILILASMVNKWSGTLADDAPQEKLGFWVEVVGFLVVVILAMAVRLWFDMAQVVTVAQKERSMWRALGRARRVTFGHFRSLFWIYFQISFTAWLALALALWIWAHMPGARPGLSFLMLELLMLWWIGTRLWQRASETVWYEKLTTGLLTLPISSELVQTTAEPLPTLR